VLQPAADTMEAVSPTAVALAPERQSDLWDAVLIAAIFAGMGALAYAAVATPLLQPILESAAREDWSRLTVRPMVIWVAMGIALMLVRTLFWVRYRPFAAASLDDAPSLTVVIPAYNEGAMVEQAIASVASALYPHERLEIIAVDDGSTDDTWTYMRRAARRFPGRVITVRLEKNRGKRGALAEAFRRARGELVVTIDSDSVIEPGTLLAVSGPFRDARVGAVAGKVAVHNRRAGLIPRMLHVRFILSFDFLRSAQSFFRTVYCCPGALAAYRLSVVREVLEAWERQTFFGVPCTYGEDRALTNFILEAGYDSVYQRTAIVHTLVPETYRQLCKMYLRWDRSYIREELRFGRIVWKRPPLWRALAIYETTVTNLRFPVAYLSIALMILHAVQDPTAILRMLLAIMIVSTVYVLYYLRSERSWEFVFGILYAYFSFFALTWIFPYAALTIRARGWLTR
jgi:hyaluronan synthase